MTKNTPARTHLLTREDIVALIEALENPAPPSEKLRQAYKIYNERIESGRLKVDETPLTFQEGGQEPES